jgi:hypothetical protein
MPVLRIKAGNRCLPVVLWHVVHRQQALPALRGGRRSGNGREPVGPEMSTVCNRYVRGDDWNSAGARV